MLQSKDLEIIEKIYAIATQSPTLVDVTNKTYRNHLIHKHDKVQEIQNLVSDYVRESTVDVEVPFLSKTIKIKYGATLSRKLANAVLVDGTFNLNNYRVITDTDSRLSKMAGLDENDSFEHTEDEPLFILAYKAYDFEFPSFADADNGFIIDNIFALCRENDPRNTMMLSLKGQVDKLDIESYLSLEDKLVLENVCSIIQIALNTCIRVLDEVYVEPISLEKVVGPIDRALADYSSCLENAKDVVRNPLEERLDHEATQITQQNVNLDNKNNELNYAGTYDARKVSHLVTEIKNYVNNIVGYMDITDFYGQLGILTFENDVNRLQCIKQFLRLIYMLSTKVAYIYDAGIDLKEMEIGQLHADGTFVKDLKLIEIIECVVKSAEITEDDLNYVIELYTDKTHVVGLAMPHTDEPKPEPVQLKVNDTVPGYSQFA